MEYNAFLTKCTAEEKRVAALEILAFDCVVYPPRAEFTEFLERYPATPGKVAVEVIRIAGGEEVNEAKKA